MSQLRRNIVTGEWVIIAQERKGRPYHFGEQKHEEKCPFCPGSEEMTPGETLRISDGEDWILRVVPNKFPAVCVENESVDDRDLFYSLCEGTGRHEIVIETPLHDKTLHHLGKEQIFKVFTAYRERFVQLSKLQDIQYVQIFKNCGKNGGASLPHSHSQIVALPFIPPRLRQEMEGAKRYYDQKGQCVFCEMIRAEVNSQDRLIYQNGHFIVAAAFAPQFAYEAVFLPTLHQQDFGQVEDRVLYALADAFENTMQMMEKILGEFPYNLVLHTVPYGKEEDAYHWHLELMPRVSYHAGFEMATGTFLNSVSPEEAAKRIRGF